MPSPEDRELSPEQYAKKYGLDEQEPPGIGETAAEQAAPLSTVCKERMELVIANSTILRQDAQTILDLINANPGVDDSFCRVFGVKMDSGLTDYRKK